MHQKITLDNGLRLLTSEMPHTRSVSVVFFIAAGSRYEVEPEAGISHFIEHICFKGTEKRRGSKEISEAIESVGGMHPPRQRVAMRIDELLWPGQPLGRDIAGSKETVTALTRQQMLDFFSNLYLPNNTVVAVAGDIKQKQVQDAISQALGEWKHK